MSKPDAQLAHQYVALNSPQGLTMHRTGQDSQEHGEPVEYHPDPDYGGFGVEINLDEAQEEHWERWSLNAIDITELLVIPFAAAALVFVMGLLAWPLLVEWWAPTLTHLLKSPAAKVVGLLCALALSGGLYLIRRYLRRSYGIAEMATGLAACWASFSTLGQHSMSGTLALAGGIYVIVRGIDNYQQGREEQGSLIDVVRPAVLKFFGIPTDDAPNRYS